MEPNGVRAVFLVGFMASGKTSVGQALARRLDWDFIDLDSLIESRERQTIPEIFQSKGELWFRNAETAALRDLLTEGLKRDSVVALGGGTFVQDINRQLLRGHPTVFLDAPAAELWQRCLTDTQSRPLHTNAKQFAELYEQRLPCYREAKVTVVTSGKDLPSLCGEIERTLHSQGVTKDPGSYQHSPSHSETGESQ